MLFTKDGKSIPVRAATLGVLGILALTLMGGAAVAARDAILERTLSLEKAREQLTLGEGREIPIVLNDLVLKQLNRYVGTEEGREKMRKAFAGMARYQELIGPKLAEFGLPRELAIIPLVESRYANEQIPGRRSAGLWSFIPGTAREYELRVDPFGLPDRVDERLNEEKATIAAARYLRHLHNLFGDWRLALRGYNEGERKVARLIEEHGTRDPWELERAAPSDERYLPKITAALLIQRNAKLLEQ